MNGNLTPEARNNRVIVVAFAVLALILLVAGLFFWQSRQSPDVIAEKPQELSSASEVIAAVAELYLLPAEETPTVAELKDAKKLAEDQPFYKDARNGDYVLVYKEAAIAFIYRPSLAKLITVGPISLADQQAVSEGS